MLFFTIHSAQLSQGTLNKFQLKCKLVKDVLSLVLQLWHSCFR